MNVNLLAINVGNTRTQMGVFLENEIESTQRVDNASVDAIVDAIAQGYEQIRDAESPTIYLGSVNDRAAERIEQAAQAKLGVSVVRVERDVHIPIGRQLDRESLVGEDRLLNAAAAYDRLKQACVVVDAGTAVTVDFVDGEGTFHGGAILPGVQMMLNAMHERTAQLPQIRFARPDEPIGHNTTQAMLSGVFYGVRGAVRELVEMYAEFYGAYPRVIACGGDGEALFAGYELVELTVPELTLQGLAVTHRRELEQQGEA